MPLVWRVTLDLWSFLLLCASAPAVSQQVPSFRHSSYQGRVSNFAPVGTEIVSLSAFNTTSYSLSNNSYFAINNVTGDVTNLVSLESLLNVTINMTATAVGDGGNDTAPLTITVYHHCDLADQLLEKASQSCSNTYSRSLYYNTYNKGVRLTAFTWTPPQGNELYLDTLKISYVFTNLGASIQNSNGSFLAMNLNFNSSSGEYSVAHSATYSLIQRSSEGQFHYFTISPPLNWTTSSAFNVAFFANITDGNTTWSVVPGMFSDGVSMDLRGYTVAFTCSNINPTVCLPRLNTYRVEDNAISNYRKTCKDVFTSFTDAPERLLRELSRRCIPVPNNLYAPAFPINQYDFSVKETHQVGSHISSFSVNAMDQDGGVVKYSLEFASIPGLFGLVSDMNGEFKVISRLGPYASQTVDLTLRATDGYYNATQKLKITITDETTCPAVNSLTPIYLEACSNSVFNLANAPVILPTSVYPFFLNRYSQVKGVAWEWSRVTQISTQVQAVNRVIISYENGTVVYNATADRLQSTNVDYTPTFLTGRVSFCNSRIFVESGAKVLVNIIVDVNGSEFLRTDSANTTDGIATLEILETSTSADCARNYAYFQANTSLAKARGLDCSGGDDYSEYGDGPGLVKCYVPHLNEHIANESAKLLPDLYKPALTTVPDSVILNNFSDPSVVTDFTWTSVLCSFNQTVSTEVVWYKVNGAPLQEFVFRANDSGMYYCQGKNFYGIAKSSLVQVELYDQPRLLSASYSLSLPENSAPGTLVNQFTATSSNFLPVRYDFYYRKDSIPSGDNTPFQINAVSGELNVVDPQDAENKQKISLIVYSYLENIRTYSYPRGTKYFFGERLVTINITDFNEYNPQFSQISFMGSISSAASIGTSVSIKGGDITASDPDESKYPISLSFPGGSQYFAINSTTGEITTIASLVSIQNTIQVINIQATELATDFRSEVTVVRITVPDLCQDLQKSLTSVLSGSISTVAPSQLCTSMASLTLSTFFLNGSEFWFVGDYTVYDGSGLVFETLSFYHHQLPPSDDVGRISVQFIYFFGEGETTVSLPMEHTLEREKNSSVWKISPPIISKGLQASHEIIFKVFLTANGSEVEVKPVIRSSAKFEGDYVYMNCKGLDEDHDKVCKGNLTFYKRVKRAVSQAGMDCNENTLNRSDTVLSFLRNLTRDCIVLPTEVPLTTPRAVTPTSAVPTTPFYCKYTGLSPVVTTMKTQKGDTLLECTLQGKEGGTLKSDNETIVDWSFLDKEQLSEKELENRISFVIDLESRVSFPQLVVRGRYRCCVSCSRDNTSVCSESFVINLTDVKLFWAN